MIFVGDISLPFKDSILLQPLPKHMLNKNWFGNLEGALIDNCLKNKTYTDRVVFNDKTAIKSLCSNLNFSGFALANNHIFDTGSYDDTTQFLNDNNIAFGGIGKSSFEANKPIIFFENGKKIIILNFGWEVIQCEVFSGKKHGVNPLTKNHVISTVKKSLKDYPDANIIAFMHWNYELEAEPQPLERELAKKIIDMGISGVIGCHPHRIGGFEMHKGKPIIYSLGNWMFKQNYFHNGRINFPDFCNQEVACEWDFETNKIKFHFFNLDKNESKLSYSHSEDISSETMRNFTPFYNLSNEDYKKYYKKNHFHKNKGLPIYYWEDTDFKIKIKNKLNKLRDLLIHILLKFR
tara:strand:- start:34 stop:1080 length:1047 start_codon:yes stop_codon:yes gene_type:complete